jgi:large subunit ribosomal protein L29
MKAAKIRESDTNDLKTQDLEIQEQLFRLRLQINMGQTEGLKKYRTLRKDRARILTILREREQAAGK